MRASGHFSDTSLNWLHSVSINRMSPSDAIDLQLSLNLHYLHSVPST